MTFFALRNIPAGALPQVHAMAMRLFPLSAYPRMAGMCIACTGAATCCRHVRPAEPQRASRWWWEKDAQKECGLHIENGKVARAKIPEPTGTI